MAASIDSPDQRRLPPLLRRAWYGLNQAFRRRIAHLELTPDQYTVLRTLTERNGITQSQLAAAMSSDPNTIASLVHRMEKAGLIVRQPHASDRRSNRLELSRRGQVRFDQARQVAVALQEEVLAALPKSDHHSFLAHLSLIAETCRRAAETSLR